MYLICLIIAGSLKINPDCTRLSVVCLYLYQFLGKLMFIYQLIDIFSDKFDNLLHYDMCLILHNECIVSSQGYDFNNLMI